MMYLENNEFRRFSFHKQFIQLVSLLILFIFLVIPCSAEIPNSIYKKILIIPSYDYNFHISRLFIRGVTNEFTYHSDFESSILIENLQLSSKGSDWRHMDDIIASLEIKYSHEKPDLIIVQYNQALHFMLKYGQDIFGNVPVVFSGLTDEGGYKELHLPENFTGITSPSTIINNLKLILNNHPKVQKIYIIAGSTPIEQRSMYMAISEGKSLNTNVEFLPLTNITYMSLLDQISKISGNSAILYEMFYKDADGMIFVPSSVSEDISKIANVPVYGMSETFLGTGITGGYLTSNENMGKKAAEIAIQILSGKGMPDNRIISEPIASYKFDDRQLKRWAIEESILPKESHILFKRTSTWESHKRGIIITIFIVLIQTFLILGLLTHRAQRIKAEESLREKESRYRAFFEEGADGVVVIDTETTKFIEFNDQACKQLGYTREEFAQLSISDIEAKETEPEIRSRIQKVLREGRDDFETLQRTKQGEIKYIKVTAKLIYLGDRTIYFCIWRDDTATWNAEEAAIREKDFSDNTINALPGVFFMYDSQGKLARWNKKCEELSGYSFDDLSKMNVVDFFPESYRPLITASSEIVLINGEGTVEAPFLTKNGGKLPYFFTGRAILLENKQYIVGTGIDISDRKRAEQEYHNLQEQLFQAQKMEAIGLLAGGVAHDFNNMLGVINGYTELAMALCSSTTDKLYYCLQMILKAASRSTNLVRQLLAFSRKETIAPLVMDLNDTISGSIKMIQRLIGEQIEFIWKPSSSPWQIKIDPSQLDQILVNLCVNARDAIAGVGKIAIETENMVIDDTFCGDYLDFTPGEYVMLSISDNGCGMDNATLDHIFEPFFTTKEIGKGTGLGLPTVYGIVKQNHGNIIVDTEPGTGTTFKIYLPRFIGENHQITDRVVNKIPEGNGETILLTEDDPLNLEMNQDMLIKLGYNVLVASTPAQSINMAKAYTDRINLLITDVVMPEMNGRKLQKTINEFIPELKCLFVSGYPADYIARSGVLEEGVNFLKKPFSMNELALKVREVLDR